MTKTITQWLDSLSPRAQTDILDALSEVKYYPQQALTPIEDSIDPNALILDFLSGKKEAFSQFTTRWGSSADSNRILAYLSVLNKYKTKEISRLAYLKFFDEYTWDMSDYKFRDRPLLAYLSLEDKRMLLTDIPNSHYNNRVGSFIKKVICTDDFDTFADKLSADDLDFLNGKPYMNEFVNKDVQFRFYKERCGKFSYRDFVENPKMFDHLFFGKNGWSLRDKQHVLRELFSYYDTRRICEFFEKIVTVDKYWLHSVMDLVATHRGFATHLYELTKADCKLPEDYDENNEFREIGDKYRFPKDIRKVFLIAHCCYRKSLPKTKNAAIGDVASLIRFYDFNFSNIIDCLYPDNTEPKFMQEVVTQINN